MAMPQQDDYIEQIHRLEGLIAFEGRPRRAAFPVSRSPVRLSGRGFLHFGQKRSAVGVHKN